MARRHLEKKKLFQQRERNKRGTGWGTAAHTLSLFEWQLSVPQGRHSEEEKPASSTSHRYVSLYTLTHTRVAIHAYLYRTKMLCTCTCILSSPFFLSLSLSFQSVCLPFWFFISCISCVFFIFHFFYCVERAQFSPPTGNSSKSWCVRSIQSFSHTGLTPGLTFISLPHLFLFSSSLHHLLFFIFLWYFLTFFSFSLSLAPSSYPSVRSINMPNRLCVCVCVYMLCHCILASSIHRDCTVPGRGHLSFSLLFSVHVPCLPPPPFLGGEKRKKKKICCGDTE